MSCLPYHVAFVFSFSRFHEFHQNQEKQQMHDSTREETQQINPAVHCTEQKLTVHSFGKMEETE